MNAEHSHTLTPGTLVDAYRIDAVIGSGGFGVTYRGMDTKLDQRVAIKEYFPSHLAVRADDTMLAPRTSGDSEAYSYGLERFLREARTLAQFRNPNIVRVNRYVEDNNTAYLVMDYEDGQPLSTLLERIGRLNDRQAFALTVHLLRGLAAVHAHDCLHRDIKPPNIFIRRSGPPLLLDFGAARFALEQRTGTLTVMYTPGYAPIEQYGGNEMQGAWSDLYATGATLFHCLTGAPPVASVERVSTLHSGRSDPLAPGFGMIRSQVRPVLADALEQMLAPRAQERPSSAARVLEMLQPSSPVQQPVDTGPTVVNKPFVPAPAAYAPQSYAPQPSVAAPAPRHEAPSQSPALTQPAVAPPLLTPTAPASAVTQADVESATALLAEHIGPIARMLAQRVAVQVDSRGALFARLADELDDDEERERFLRQAGIGS